MITIDDAKRIVHRSELKPREQLLVLLAVEPAEPLRVGTIRERCSQVGLQHLANKNISDFLGKSKGLVARIHDRWELLDHGALKVQELARAANVNVIVTQSSNSLRSHAEQITDSLAKSFVMEAILCFEAKQFRAAIVFSWASAIAVLHRFIFANRLAQFNSEAKRRNSKWRPAIQQDDLGRMQERDFLEVCDAIGVIGKNVKTVLQNECLNLRNACGHPNSLSIAENSVAAHIEKLIMNVFAKF